MQTEERSEQSDRDRESDQLTNEQRPDKRDIEQDHSVGLEIG
jgi:hypothetical protein